VVTLVTLHLTAARLEAIIEGVRQLRLFTTLVARLTCIHCALRSALFSPRHRAPRNGRRYCFVCISIIIICTIDVILLVKNAITVAPA
jgi:hypothetical protein